MKTVETIIPVAIWIAIVGATFSIICLAWSGAGDSAPAYMAYIIASAIVFGFCILADAIAHKNDK